MSELQNPGFKLVTLGNIAHIEMGQSPDSQYVHDDPEIGIAFLQGNAEFSTVSPFPKYGCTQPAKLVETGDVLISVRAPVGEVNIADRPYCIGRGLAGIRVTGFSASLSAYLISRQSRELHRVAQGTTFEAINKNDLLKLELLVPPEGERERIAQILDSLDTAIHETEAIIVKLQAVKQGLLHDLLTRGLDASGQLRPPPALAPELYQDSPLGLIPKEWVVGRLHQVTDVIDPQPDHRTPRELVDGVPYVGIGDFDAFGNVLFSSCRKVIWEALYKQEQRFAIDSGDIIYGKIGTIGQPKLLPSGRYALTANVLLMKPKANRSFFFHTLAASYFEKQIQDVTNTTSQPALGIETVRNLQVFLVPRTEQTAIAHCLDSAMLQLRQERTLLEKLQQQKSGLMDDLLTGRVRVKVAETEMA